MESDTYHHPDIRAALAVLARTNPAAAGRASSALAILLRRYYSSGARSFSRLTGDGFPLEFAFSTGHSELCYTADPGGDEAPAGTLLHEALALLVELGQPPAGPRVIDHITACQKAAPDELRYGAWVGGRHPIQNVGDAAQPHDRFKLYAEIPERGLESHQALLKEYLDLPERLTAAPMHLAMVGIEPCSDRVEFYFRRRNVELTALPSMLEPAGLRACAPELTGLIREAYGYPLTGRLPGGSVGFSYAITLGSGRVTFTLFLFTRLLWGGDARIRQRFSERLRAAGQDPTPYEQMTAPLEKRDVYQTYHGLLGLSLTPAAPIQLSLGVRPPPVCCPDQ